MANEYLKVQKLANSSAKAIQKMVNKANEKALKFNAEEAKKAREFNAKEAATARSFNANESAITRAFNASEAQKARDWQTEMSNTAHQREVEDLKKAGLNPVLSAGAGATSYTTSSASASPASAVGASSNNASGSVDSGAGAIGNIFAGVMSAMTGLEQTRLQTEASVRAAQISASASRYVADRNYEAKMDEPKGSPFALFDKYLGRAGSDLKKDANSVNWSNLKGTNNGTHFIVQGKWTKEQDRVFAATLLKLGYNRGYLDTLASYKLGMLKAQYYHAFVKNDVNSLKALKDVKSNTKFINSL